LIAIGWLVGLSLFATPAFAQEAAPDRNSEDIVVTGQKLQESLLDTPVSVTVIRAEEIDNPAFSDVLDYIRALPNVSTTSGSTLPTVRGIDGNGVAAGAFGAISGGRPRITTYVDGVPRSFSIVQNGVPTTWDVAQVEFFRGAQSTGIGRNAIAGAIVVATAEPEDRVGGAVQAGIRSAGTTYSAAGTVNLPIVSDRLALRVSYDRYDGEGFINYEGPGFDPFRKTIRRDDGERFRAKLAWRPNGFSDPTSIRLMYERQTSARASPDDVVDATGRYTLIDQYALGFFETASDLGSIEVRLPIAAEWSVYAIGSYLDARDRAPGLDPADPTGSLNIAIRSQEWTQEVRLAYEASHSRLRGVIGAFHFTRDRTERGLPGTSFPYEADDQASTLALFADAVIPVGQFDILAGGRWERERQDRFFTSDFGLALDYDRTEEIFLPKAGVRWNVSDDRTLTALYFRGYSPAAASVSFLTGSPYQFERETSDTYEVAWRSRHAGGRLTFEANLFVTDYQGQQVAAPAPSDPSDFIIINAARTRYYGTEASLIWKPSKRLELQASFGLLHSEIRDFGDPVNNVNNGNELDFAPSYTARLAATWRPVDRLELAAVARLSDGYFSDYENLQLDRVGASAMFDLRASMDLGPVTLFGYVDNVTNRFQVISSNAPFSRNVARPRTVGAAIRAKF
jgi:outer membrane receptor protein involved in Fe transport